MSEFEVKTEGLDKVKALLKNLPANLNEESQKNLRKALENVRDKAKQLVPVDTGSLQKSIRLTQPQKNVMGVSAGGYITNPKTGRKVDYAGAVEYGTSRSQARPYMRPAVIANLWKIQREMIEALKKAINVSF